MSQQRDAQIAAQTESAVRNHQHQLRVTRDAEHAAKVSLAFLTLWKSHWAEGLSTCTSNRLMIERLCDEQMWDCADIRNLEAAYQSVKSSLAFVPIAERVPPTAQPVTESVTPVTPLTEQEELRALVIQFKGDDQGLKNAMRARLRATDPARNRPTVLPAEITAAVIRSMKSTELRSLQTKWFGTSAINDRLQGKS